MEYLLDKHVAEQHADQYSEQSQPRAQTPKTEVKAIDLSLSPRNTSPRQSALRYVTSPTQNALNYVVSLFKVTVYQVQIQCTTILLPPGRVCLTYTKIVHANLPKFHKPLTLFELIL